MIEIALAIVAVAQSGLLYYILNSQKEERMKLMNAVIAKNAEELAGLEIIDKERPQKKAKIDDSMVPVENLSDDDFKKYVLET